MARSGFGVIAGKGLSCSETWLESETRDAARLQKMIDLAGVSARAEAARGERPVPRPTRH
jgi:hypothetical protein